jgi:hypothetical protein
MTWALACSSAESAVPIALPDPEFAATSEVQEKTVVPAPSSSGGQTVTVPPAPELPRDDVGAACAVATTTVLVLMLVLVVVVVLPAT